MRPKTVGVLGFAAIVSAFFIPAAQAAIPATERNALILLYDGTDGDNWEGNTNWRKSPGVFNDPGTECSWYGVICDAGETTVRALCYLGNRLTGAIPPELGDLAGLTELRLIGNPLTGAIPTELGRLADLRVLDLADNELEGTIPPELSRLANLLELDLARNKLEGAIPPELGLFADLMGLRLSGNRLTGAIPRELGDLVDLQRLYLGGNHLEGAIPAELGRLASLRSLDLNANRLAGAIPRELGDLVDLQRLDLSGNHLEGAIPAELGALANLRSLLLDRNRLEGTVPSELGDLGNLRSLRLDWNRLEGEIPPELAKPPYLRSLDLSNNLLTGRIPPGLGEPIYLNAVALANNHLTGGIPSELGQLADLQILILDHNHLEGAIPTELGNLTSLLILTLAENRLYTDDNALREFLNSKVISSDWESTQTLHRRFAEFGDGGGLFSQIVLFSLNDVAAATGRVEILGASGEPLTIDLDGEVVSGTRDLSVPARGLLSLSTDALGGVQQGSVRVTTDRHVEGVVIYGGDFGLAGVGSSPDAPSGFVAPVRSDPSLGVNTGIAVTLLGGQAAALDLSLLDAGGEVLAEASETLPANGHAALFVTEIEWNAPVDFSAFSGTLVATSPQPVAATVIQTRAGEFVTLPVTPLRPLGQSAPQGTSAPTERRLRFAQFADGGGLTSQVLLLNLSDLEPAQVEILVRDDSGSPLAVDLDGELVAGEKRLEILPRGLGTLATDGLGDVREGSLTVTSDQPLAGVVVFSGPGLGAAGVDSSQELPEGFVAPIETDAGGGLNTGVALMNLEAETTTVDAELLAADGRTLARARIALAGMGHEALYVTELQWDDPVDFSRFEGLLRVRADGRTAATVIQTRPGQFATLPVSAKPAN